MSRSFTAASVLAISASLGTADLRQVLRHDVRHGMALRLLLQLAADPGTLGPIEDRVHTRLALGQRPVVEIGGVVHMARGAVGIEFDIEHPLGDDAALTRAREAGVLDRMLEVEQHARLRAGVAFVHQHGAALRADRGGARG